VRFTEVVEDGISGGNVIPDDFAPTPEGLTRVRENLLKSAYVGRLVASDFSGFSVHNRVYAHPGDGRDFEALVKAGRSAGELSPGQVTHRDVALSQCRLGRSQGR